MATRFKWRASDSDFLRDNYHLMGPQECATQLKCSIRLIQYHAQRLGLRQLGGEPEYPLAEAPNLEGPYFFLLNKTKGRYWVGDLKKGQKLVNDLVHRHPVDDELRKDYEGGDYIVVGSLKEKEGYWSPLHYGYTPLGVREGQHDCFNKLWVAQEAIVSQYYNGEPVREIASRYDSDYATIRRLLMKWGIWGK